mmetsp:Transcript_110778/g.320115  ORF Transcript_110778/g.320115 Transcript_110778/m.320115 type:complete len:300 (+) Transcript_110778:227-1126(+)
MHRAGPEGPARAAHVVGLLLGSFVVLAAVGLVVGQRGLRLVLLLEVVRLLHDVVGCKGELRVPRGEGRRAHQRKATFLVGLHEARALQAVADVEVRKTRPLCNGDGPRPDQGPHGGDPVGLVRVRELVHALVAIDLDVPSRRTLGVLGFERLQVPADGLEQLLLGLRLLLLVDRIYRLLGQAAFLNIEFRPSGLAGGQQSRGAMNPTIQGCQCLVSRKLCLGNLQRMLQRWCVFLAGVLLVVARDRQGARRCDACNLRPQEVPLLPGKPRCGEYRATQVATHQLLDLPRSHDVARTRGG